MRQAGDDPVLPSRALDGSFARLRAEAAREGWRLIPSPTSQRFLWTAAAAVLGVACGNEHTLLLCADGCVLSFGKGRHGRLGHGDEADARSPRVVRVLAQREVIGVVAGGKHSGAIT